MGLLRRLCRRTVSDPLRRRLIRWKPLSLGCQWHWKLKRPHLRAGNVELQPFRIRWPQEPGGHWDVCHSDVDFESGQQQRWLFRRMGLRRRLIRWRLALRDVANWRLRWLCH